jgi:Ca2+-binding RTX toxin-like protein
MTHSHPFRRLAAAAGALVLAATLTAVAASAAWAAPAPGLYGATGVLAPDSSQPGDQQAADRTPPSQLYRIDPATGAATAMGSIGHPVTGLALDPTSGTLYGVTAGVEQSTTPRQLIRLNSDTGAGTVVGSIGANDVVDIAFNSAGQLFGWSTTTDDLVRIDKATGALTIAGDAGVTETYGGGLSFGAGGVLHGLIDLDYGHLWTLDPATGGVTRGPQLSGSPNTTGGAGMNAAAYGCGGATLYSIVNDFGSAPSHLVTVATDDGEITSRGPTRGSADLALDALEWVCAGPSAQTTPVGGGAAGNERCGHQVMGSAASERLIGTEAGDHITGFAGDDRIEGRGGDDCVNGLDGDDLLLGGDGVDTVDGGKGDDRMNGGSGRGLLRGGTGTDRITGGSESDVLQGNTGRDRLSGGAGGDELLGGADRDLIIGGPGRDSIEAGAGNDRISAKDGVVDVIDCGRGRDTVVSRDRQDKLTSCERR